VDAARRPDASVVQPNPDARKHIARVLRKEDVDQQQIEAILSQYDRAPENERRELHSGLAAVKWRVDKVEPALDGPLLSVRVLVKIGYEFVACHLGATIYEESKQLAALRANLSQSCADRSVFSIERLTTRKYAPVHFLGLNGTSPHVVVTICLFGWLLFRVHFLQIGIRPPYYRYVCHLDTGEEYCELLNESATCDQRTTG